jgi:nitrogenase molybdenum-iron protein NifN
MGCEVSAAVAPSRAPVLDDVPAAQVKLGDLEDLELAAREHGADLVISNSHALETAQHLGVPLLRAGFPQYDLIGGYQRLWVGYRGTRQTLFDLANILVSTATTRSATVPSTTQRRPAMSPAPGTPLRSRA